MEPITVPKVIPDNISDAIREYNQAMLNLLLLVESKVEESVQAQEELKRSLREMKRQFQTI